MPPRFLTLADVQEVLNISAAQAYALVRSGELPALQVGGRGVWRVEATELEAYIQRLYAESRARAQAGPETEAAQDAPALTSTPGSEPGYDPGSAPGSESGHEV